MRVKGEEVIPFLSPLLLSTHHPPHRTHARTTPQRGSAEQRPPGSGLGLKGPWRAPPGRFRCRVGGPPRETDRTLPGAVLVTPPAASASAGSPRGCQKSQPAQPAQLRAESSFPASFTLPSPSLCRELRKSLEILGAECTFQGEFPALWWEEAAGTARDLGPGHSVRGGSRAALGQWAQTLRV